MARFQTLGEQQGYAAKVAEEDRRVVGAIAGQAASETTELGLKASAQVAQSLKQELESGQHLNLEFMSQALKNMRGTLVEELSRRKFVFIPHPRDEFLENDSLFGDQVHWKFKEVRKEIKDAGNCIAAGLYTAAVFHLMRVSEHGLRTIARKVGAKVHAIGQPQPLEYGDWNKVIRQCRVEIEKTRELENGPEKQERLQMFTEAAGHCEHMKDIWRNEMTDSRRRYDADEAIAVFSKVKDFMMFLVSTPFAAVERREASASEKVNE